MMRKWEPWHKYSTQTFISLTITGWSGNWVLGKTREEGSRWSSHTRRHTHTNTRVTPPHTSYSLFFCFFWALDSLFSHLKLHLRLSVRVLFPHFCLSLMTCQKKNPWPEPGPIRNWFGKTTNKCLYLTQKRNEETSDIISFDLHPGVAIFCLVDKSISLSSSIPNLSLPTGSVESVSIRWMHTQVNVANPAPHFKKKLGEALSY